MSTFISRIDDVFQIAGRGCVVLPGLPKSGDFKIKIGDRINLRKPDGSEILTVIRGMGMPLGARVEALGIPMLLGVEITKEMIPIGTELWLP